MARRTAAAKARKKNETPERGRSNHVTYRELRNTPGKVWERLEADQPLTLMAGGEPKALLIPIPTEMRQRPWRHTYEGEP
jgi:hypothetical protein